MGAHRWALGTWSPRAPQATNQAHGSVRAGGQVSLNHAQAPGTPGGKPAIFANPLFLVFLTEIISTAPWTRSKRFPAISRFYNCLSGNFMGKFRREMKKQLGRRAEWPGWRPRWRATWQRTESWHPSSRAAGTIQAGLGHLPRTAEPSLIHMPLILGRRDPGGIRLRASSLPHRRPRIRHSGVHTYTYVILLSNVTPINSKK